jgi:hypothetical protein
MLVGVLSVDEVLTPLLVVHALPALEVPAKSIGCRRLLGS